MRLLTINPGSTSTKLGIYIDGKIEKEFSINHSAEELENFDKSIDQKEFRSNIVKEFLEEHGYKAADFNAIVGRGAPIKPVESGVYKVNEKMLHDLYYEVSADHPSILGAVIAEELAKSAGISAYIVDPVSVDEFEEVARISGIPEIPRISLGHTLNIKAVAKRFAKDIEKKYEDMNLVICHLGGGISITAHKNGKMVDVNNANDDGPFSPERSGGLPAGQLVKMCFSGKYASDKDLKKYLTKKGGLIAYLNSNSVRDLKNGNNPEAQKILSGMIYQIAKEIGKMATVLNGKVDYIVMTGGIVNNTELMNELAEYTDFIAPMKLYPGEEELLALGEGVHRILEGKEEEKEYV